MEWISRMHEQLFRKEAIEARRTSWLGGIAVAAPLSRWVLILLACALSCAIVLLLVLGRYTRRESVSGELVPGAGLLNIAAPISGTVRRVLVHDGQSVKAGDVLMELANEQDSAELGDTHAIVAESLEAQRARLQADLAIQQRVASQQGAALKDKIRLLKAQLVQVQGQLVLQQQQTDSASTLLERIRPLAAKGYVSAVQIQQQEATVLQGRAQYKTLVRQQLDTEQQLAAAGQELARLPLDTSAHDNETERQLATLRQSLAQNAGQRAIVLRAPSDGVISAVLPKAGQMVTMSQPLLSMLPAHSKLEAQLLVPSRAVGFIEPGSRVVLRYQAFPYQKFGQQFGRVVDVSRSALSPSDVSALVGQQTNQPLYRVQVALDRQYVMAYGKAEAVKPGMMLEADVLMDRRRLIEWVFEPLYGMRHRLAGGTSRG